MNAPDLDSSIRIVLRTAVASAPNAPDIDDITYPSLGLRPGDTIAHQPRRALIGAGLLAAAALVGGLVTVDLGPGDPGERQSNAPPSVPVTGLPSYVLPSHLPTGWAIVDVLEAPYSSGETWMPAGQLFRHTGDGAAIRLGIEPTVSERLSEDSADTAVTVVEGTAPAPSTAGREGTSVTDGLTQFSEREAEVRVEAVGVSDADATVLLRSLRPTGTGAALRFSSPDASWIAESEVEYRPPGHAADGPFGVVVVRSDDGRSVTINLFPADEGNQMWKLGIPETANGMTTYVNRWHLSRQIGDLVASASSADGQSIDESRALLATLIPVDEVAWVRAIAQLATDWRSTPIVASLTIGDYDIDLRVESNREGVCATRRGDTQSTRCHPAPHTNWGDPLPAGTAPIDVDLLVRGRWLHVGRWPSDKSEVSLIATGDVPGEIETASTSAPGGNVLVAALAPATMTEIHVQADDEVSSYSFDAVRPVH